MGSYVPNSPAVRQQMLEAMGAASIRDLYANVPEEMFLKELACPPARASWRSVGPSPPWRRKTMYSAPVSGAPGLTGISFPPW